MMKQGIYLQNGVLRLDGTALVEVHSSTAAGVSHYNMGLYGGDDRLKDYDCSGLGLRYANGNVYYGKRLLAEMAAQDTIVLFDVKNRYLLSGNGTIVVRLGGKPKGAVEVVITGDAGVTVTGGTLSFDTENWSTAKSVKIAISTTGVHEITATCGDASRKIEVIVPEKTILFSKDSGFNMAKLSEEPVFTGSHIYSSSDSLNGTLAIGKTSDGTQHNMASVEIGGVPLKLNEREVLYFTIAKVSSSNSNCVMKVSSSDTSTVLSETVSFDDARTEISSNGSWTGYLETTRGVGDFESVTSTITIATQNVGFYYVKEIGILNYEQ